MAELCTVIEADQQMLIQFAEEKMALACQCFDLVDMHLMQIDRDIEKFEDEIQVRKYIKHTSIAFSVTRHSIPQLSGQEASRTFSVSPDGVSL